MPRHPRRLLRPGRRLRPADRVGAEHGLLRRQALRVALRQGEPRQRASASPLPVRPHPRPHAAEGVRGEGAHRRQGLPVRARPTSLPGVNLVPVKVGERDARTSWSARRRYGTRTRRTTLPANRPHGERGRFDVARQKRRRRRATCSMKRPTSGAPGWRVSFAGEEHEAACPVGIAFTGFRSAEVARCEPPDLVEQP